MPTAAIVLAAGESRRLGLPKQLLQLDGESLLSRTLRLAREAGCSPVLAVLGAHHQEIAATLPRQGITLVLNENWREGIAGSIQSGLWALRMAAPQAEGALLLACDQPRLTVAHLRALLDAFRAEQGQAIAASSYAGVLGVPAVFPRAAFAELLALTGDKGARSLLAAPPCALVSVAFPGGEIDIDLPADLARLDEPLKP